MTQKIPQSKFSTQFLSGGWGLGQQYRSSYSKFILEQSRIIFSLDAEFCSIRDKKGGRDKIRKRQRRVRVENGEVFQT